jgi:hypothetical protein
LPDQGCRKRTPCYHSQLPFSSSRTFFPCMTRRSPSASTR